MWGNKRKLLFWFANFCSESEFSLRPLRLPHLICQLQSNFKKIPFPCYTASVSLILPPYDFGDCPRSACAAPIKHSISSFPVLWLKYKRLYCAASLLCIPTSLGECLKLWTSDLLRVECAHKKLFHHWSSPAYEPACYSACVSFCPALKCSIHL